MTIVQHLEELRRVITISGGAWLGAWLVLFAIPPVRGWLLTLLLHPITHVLSGKAFPFKAPIVTGVTETLTIPLELTAIAACILTLPVTLWQVWSFVAPGLRPVERRFAGPFVASALVLFVLGGAFAYFVMPLGLGFLATFLGGNATFVPDLGSYLTFFAVLVLVFGITFELPIVIVMLGMLGIVSSRWLRNHRKVIICAIVGTSLVITPGADPFTPTALAIPLIIFFELSILVLDRVLHR